MLLNIVFRIRKVIFTYFPFSLNYEKFPNLSSKFNVIIQSKDENFFIYQKNLLQTLGCSGTLLPFFYVFWLNLFWDWYLHRIVILHNIFHLYTIKYSNLKCSAIVLWELQEKLHSNVCNSIWNFFHIKRV